MGRGLSGIDISLKTYDKYDTSTARYHVAYLSSANTARVMNTMGVAVIGVIQDASPNTSSCAVRLAGTTKLWMNDTCSAGDYIVSNTAGAGDMVTLSANTSTNNYPLVGIANEACAATGTIIEVIMIPGNGNMGSVVGTLT